MPLSGEGAILLCWLADLRGELEVTRQRISLSYDVAM
jgi:hypothetical protein